MQDFDTIVAKEKVLAKELDRIRQAISANMRDIHQDEDQQEALQVKYQAMQELVENAFKPLYHGDDDAAVNAVKQVRSSVVFVAEASMWHVALN